MKLIYVHWLVWITIFPAHPHRIIFFFSSGQDVIYKIVLPEKCWKLDDSKCIFTLRVMFARPNGYRWPSGRGRPLIWCIQYPNTAGPTKGSNTRPSIRLKTTQCAVTGCSTSTPVSSNHRLWTKRVRWTSTTIKTAHGCWTPTSNGIWP